MTCAGQPGDQILLDQPHLFDRVTQLVNEGKAVDAAYLGFSKALDTASPVEAGSLLLAQI